MTNPLRNQPQPAIPTHPLGCLMFPFFLAIISLALGGYLALHWSDYTLLLHIVTILLLTLGSLLTLMLLIFFTVLYTAYRLARRLQKDVQNIAQDARAMLNPSHPPIDIHSTEVPAPPETAAGDQDTSTNP